MGYEPDVDADMTLSDGRRIAYCEWGPPDGRPIILSHGAPGSRVFGPDAGTTAEAGVRLITVDRPGYGRSDPKPDRQILDWSADVEELTAALEVGEFDVAGHSSGGPYALACAYKLPQRVKRVALVSCIAPYSPPLSPHDDDGELTRLAQENPEQAAEKIAASAAWLVQTPERFLDLPRPEPDQQLLTDPAIRSMFAKTIREAVKQGAAAYGWDCSLERRPWGFALAEVGADVWIFQGEQDGSVHPSQAGILAAEIPGNQLRVFPGEGHGLILSKWREILGDLRSI